MESAGEVRGTILCSPRPRFFYGWVMLPIAIAGFVATSPAQTFGLSVFNASFRESLGLSHGQLTGAYMLGTLLASLGLVRIGAIADRRGLRWTMTVVVLLLGGACLAASLVSGLFTLFLAFLLLRFLGQGALGLLSANTLSYWFDRRLGMVEGLRNLGMAGSMAVIPAVNWQLIEWLGWRGAFVILGLGVWALMLPLMLLYRNRPEDINQFKDGISPDEDSTGRAAELRGFTLQEATRTPAFWLMSASMAVWAMIGTGIFFNIIPLLEWRGFGESQAAHFFVFFAGTMAAMHVVAGCLADRLPLNGLLTAGVLMASVSVQFLAGADSAVRVNLAACSLGATQATLTAVASQMFPRYYGREHLCRIRGVQATLMVGAASIGPFIMGILRDWTGSYGSSLTLFTMISSILVLLTPFAVPPRGRTAGSGSRWMDDNGQTRQETDSGSERPPPDASAATGGCQATAR